MRSGALDSFRRRSFLPPTISSYPWLQLSMNRVVTIGSIKPMVTIAAAKPL
jgi:hypothetical protein